MSNDNEDPTTPDPSLPHPRDEREEKTTEEDIVDEDVMKTDLIFELLREGKGFEALLLASTDDQDRVATFLEWRDDVNIKEFPEIVLSDETITYLREDTESGVRNSVSRRRRRVYGIIRNKRAYRPRGLFAFLRWLLRRADDQKD